MCGFDLLENYKNILLAPKLYPQQANFWDFMDYKLKLPFFAKFGAKWETLLQKVVRSKNGSAIRRNLTTLAFFTAEERHAVNQSFSNKELDQLANQ